MTEDSYERRLRARLSEYVQRVEETPEARESRIQVCNTARELRSRLRGYVPISGSTPSGAPTSYDEESNTLHVYVSRAFYTRERVMKAIWSVVPNCSAVHIDIIDCSG